MLCDLFSGQSHEVPFYDPVFKYYEPHKGEIVSIKFLVHRKDMFLSSGTDGEIRVYLLDQVSYFQVLSSFKLSKYFRMIQLKSFLQDLL